MRVNSIFHSLSGEGIHTGIPTVFIRLQGCNLNCSWCDTKYALEPEGGELMTISTILTKVKTFKPAPSWVLITGGEPLIQGDKLGGLGGLVGRLRDMGYLVEIETNGSIDPSSWWTFVDSWSVDVKCPSSGLSFGSFKQLWCNALSDRDQLKFVVDTVEDLNFTKDFISSYKGRATILVSPVGVIEDKIWLQRVAEFCKEQNVRLSLQTQKIIWEDRKDV